MGRRDSIPAVLVATVLAAPCDAASPHANVRLRHDALRRRVELVLDGAAHRFATTGCAEVLSAFRDQSGRPLAEVLAASGRSAPAYLDSILFYDGDQEESCRKKRIRAVTIPGIRVVKICPSFHHISVRDPVEAEAVLIHEALHTLGLGENPPHSREITEQVLKHCR